MHLFASGVGFDATSNRAENRNSKWYCRDLEVFLFENVRAAAVHPCVPDTRRVHTYAGTKSHLHAASIGSFEVCSTFFWEITPTRLIHDVTQNEDE